MEEDTSYINLKEMQIKMVKEEPPDGGGGNNCSNDDFYDLDVVTYLDVTLDNNSDTDDDLRKEYSELEPPFRCEICQLSFQTFGNLVQHCKIHDRNPLCKKSICTICHKRFEARELAYHFRSHNVARLYQCFYCDCSYFTQAQLSAHVQTHMGYTCNKCQLHFEKDIDLQEHYKSHVDEFLYACNICDKKFATTKDLSGHVTTHKRKRKLDPFT